MARITITSIVSVTLLLPTALCRPFHFHAGQWFPAKDLPHYHSPPDYDPTPTPYQTAPSIYAPTAASSYPSYPTSYPHPTGTASSYIYPSSYATFAPTGTATGTGMGTGTAIPSATGTTIPYPSPYLNTHEAEALAKEKRHIFEGPRRHHFPHYWPPYHHSEKPPGYGSSTGIVGPTGTGGGIGRPSGTGVGTGGVSSGWMPTGSLRGYPMPPGAGGAVPTGYGYYGY